MKKLILSLIIGAIFIGAGIGVLFVEMAEFTSTDYLPYVQQTKTEKFVFDDTDIFSGTDSHNVVVNLQLDEYFRTNGSYKVVEDKSVQGISMEIEYHGKKPTFRFHNNWYDKDNNTNWYTLYCYADTVLPKDIIDAAKYMFGNKVIVTSPSNYYIEKVVIKTNHPELITITP